MGAIKASEWVKGKMVGCGSFGTVHLAMNKSTGGLFVVKSTHSGDGREALDNEVKILNTLNSSSSSSSSSSPYIVQCLGTEEDKLGNLHVFMEYMGGGSLADVAHKFGGSLDEEVVRLYTREILHGLKHLHQHGIVHCDLKCKNVLLGSSGNVKLADFGCAKWVKEKNYSWQKKSCIIGGGTPLWMAPEVLRNERLDYGADIWSLGCTVIEMATGRPPWADEISVSVSNSNNNPMAAVFRIARGDDGMLLPQFPRHFSKEGLDFLSRCLERDPNKRSTVDELLSHPFVVSTSTTTTTKESAAASSPASVLEVPKFEDDLDDELESPAGRNDFSIRSRNSSYLRYHDHPQRTTLIWQLEDAALGGGGGNWITIR